MNRLFLIIAAIFVLFSAVDAFAVQQLPAYGGGQNSGISLPTINIGVKNSSSPAETANTIKIILLLTILTLAPAILITMTSFVRIIVVLSFLRQAIGVQTMPPNQVLIGLSLFLTFFIMAPTLKTINTEAVGPYMNNSMDQGTALEKMEKSIRKFMFSQTREKDLGLMMRIAKYKKPKTKKDVPTHVLIPSYLISELKTAFQIGFMIYLPFLIIDMIIASVLMSMGMMMLPPVMISLPFKLLLFVLVDGWSLVVGSLVKSFG